MTEREAAIAEARHILKEALESAGYELDMGTDMTRQEVSITLTQLLVELAAELNA